MNGASDAILEELLASNKAQNEILLRMANKAGADTSGIGEAGAKLGIVGKAAGIVGESFGKLIGVVGLFASGVSSLTPLVTKTAGVVKQLGDSALDGAAGLSSVTSALSGLPGPLGLMASLAGTAAAALEKNLKTQQELSKAGANFSGNLDLMRQSAAKSYLSLTEFSSIVSKNGDVFRNMGGDVQAGVNQFVKIQSALMDPKSPIAGNLATLGYNMEDAANLTASFMRTQGSMNKANLQDTTKVTAAIQQYAQELDFMSKVTGESREAIQKKMDEENAEAQWQATLAAMSPEKADKLRQGMEMAMMQGGKGAVDAFKAQAQGLPPMTEAAQMYVATQHKGAQAIKEMADRANDAGISVKQNAEMNRASLAKQISEGAMDREKLQKVLQADAAVGGELSKSFSTATKLQTAFMDKGKMMSEKEIAAKLESMATESKREKSQAEVGQAQQKAMMDLTNEILAKLLPAFKVMLDFTLLVAKALGDMITPIMNFGSKIIKSIFGETDFAELGAKLKPLFEKFKNMLEFVGDTIGVVAEKLQASPFIGTMKRVFDKLIDIIGKVVDGVKLIIESPIGTFLIDRMVILFNYFSNTVEAIVNAIGGIVDIVLGIVKFISGDVKGGLSQIGDGFKGLIGGIVGVFNAWFTMVIDSVKAFTSSFFDALKNIMGGIVDGIKGLGTGILNFFTGGGSSAPASPGATPVASSPSSPASTLAVKKQEQAQSAPSPIPASSKANDPIEILRAEIETLNTQVTSLVKFMRDAAENTGKTANILESRGNLFAR